MAMPNEGTPKPQRPTEPATAAPVQPSVSAANPPARGPSHGVSPRTPLRRSAATSGMSQSTVLAAMISATASTDDLNVGSSGGWPAHGSVATAAGQQSVVIAFFGM